MQNKYRLFYEEIRGIHFYLLLWAFLKKNEQIFLSIKIDTHIALC